MDLSRAVSLFGSVESRSCTSSRSALSSSNLSFDILTLESMPDSMPQYSTLADLKDQLPFNNALIALWEDWNLHIFAFWPIKRSMRPVPHTRHMHFS
eukprot:2501688-Pyramimonas_sp.AAC.1